MDNTLRVIVFCTLPAMLHGCGGNADAAEQRSLSNPEVIHQGIAPDSGGYTSKGYRVLTTDAAYQNELPVYSGDNPQTIDFEENRVILLDMGQRNTGGYGIGIESVSDAEDHVLVTVTLSVPGRDCIVTQALTNPYQLVKINTDKEVLIQEKLHTTNCE